MYKYRIHNPMEDENENVYYYIFYYTGRHVFWIYTREFRMNICHCIVQWFLNWGDLPSEGKLQFSEG